MTIVAVTALAHFVIPIGLAVYFWGQSGDKTKLQWGLEQGFLLCFTVFIAWYGAGWMMFGLYTRWAVLAIVVGLGAAGLSTFADRPNIPDVALSSWRAWLGVLVSGVILVAMGLSLFGIVTRSEPSDPVTLDAPLESGTFAINQGGSNPALNHHYSVSAQRHALDVVALNKWGTRASGFLPSDLSRYEIFGAPVSAPCSGDVLKARRDQPDLTPPERDTRQILGNYAAIACHEQSVTLVLAHLRQGSLQVEPGDRVERGQRIGRVGNSGNTTEPHLHVHAVDGQVENKARLTSKGTSVPMQFERLDFPLARNDTFRLE